VAFFPVNLRVMITTLSKSTNANNPTTAQINPAVGGLQTHVAAPFNGITGQLHIQLSTKYRFTPV
jgi:hypothetical protein